ncbi:hypothetical protein ABFA25_05525 [Mycobacterium lepromatosis]|uniref:hypothetical protein n=1 Tax=Mycobacterium lepromatosis TaxID=480418 RepID=UPI0006794326|nr:hypothetical protein [Mycobacterium lepromatosis]
MATLLCWTDQPKADQLRQVLEDASIWDVAILSESEAATALMPARPGAVLLVGDETATLWVWGLVAEDQDAPPTLLAAQLLVGADVSATLDTIVFRLSDQLDAPTEVSLVGVSADLTAVFHQVDDASTMRGEITDDPTLACGIALAIAPATMAQLALAAGE